MFALRTTLNLMGRRGSAIASLNVRTLSDETHFGFERVSEEEKSKKVYDVFARVANNYDLMNDLMSGGMHRYWKDVFMQRLSPTDGTELLDVAGGTGDIAFRFHRYLENNHMIGRVTVCDINKEMLRVGEERAKKAGLGGKIEWVEGDAERLPFPEESFSAYTIAFGIRNVTRMREALLEAKRVLCPGGRFLCLEFSHVDNPLLKKIYDEYSFQVIPALGQIVAGDWRSYQYLIESIRQFPNQETFADMIAEVGFKEVTFENLSCGIVAIHSAFKL
uniref:2-methoxy-6-polyprenyl-1,4-benzoquinol methylase, mitochondrial n=1 Tax=Triatoma dimidiata TaxID=72491 RepID=A0A0V0GAT2_TRIDM